MSVSQIGFYNHSFAPNMKKGLIIFLAAITLTFGVAAQSNELADRWGKSSFISAPSSTLNGVRPLASWIWDSGAENPQNYYLLVRRAFKLDKLPKDASAFVSAYAYADVYINGKRWQVMCGCTASVLPITSSTS